MLRQLMSASRGVFSQCSHGRIIQSLAGDLCLREVAPLTTLLSFRSFTRSILCSQEVDAVSKASPTNVEGEDAPRLPPWTPTRLLDKRKALPKRMGHMLLLLEKQREEEARAALQHPDFGPGDFLELKLSVPENKRRATVFKGICIARRNRGYRTSFTVRNFVGNSGGIERSFPLYSPHLLEVKVLSIAGRKKYRRSKLYFLRDVQPKEYRV